MKICKELAQAHKNAQSCQKIFIYNSETQTYNRTEIIAELTGATLKEIYKTLNEQNALEGNLCFTESELKVLSRRNKIYASDIRENKTNLYKKMSWVIVNNKKNYVAIGKKLCIENFNIFEKESIAFVTEDHQNCEKISLIYYLNTTETLYKQILDAKALSASLRFKSLRLEREHMAILKKYTEELSVSYLNDKKYLSYIKTIQIKNRELKSDLCSVNAANYNLKKDIEISLLKLLRIENRVSHIDNKIVEFKKITTQIWCTLRYSTQLVEHINSLRSRNNKLENVFNAFSTYEMPKHFLSKTCLVNKEKTGSLPECNSVVQLPKTIEHKKPEKITNNCEYKDLRKFELRSYKSNRKLCRTTNILGEKNIKAKHLSIYYVEKRFQAIIKRFMNEICPTVCKRSSIFKELNTIQLNSGNKRTKNKNWLHQNKYLFQKVTPLKLCIFYNSKEAFDYRKKLKRWKNSRCSSSDVRFPEDCEDSLLKKLTTLEHQLEMANNHLEKIKVKQYYERA